MKNQRDLIVSQACPLIKQSLSESGKYHVSSALARSLHDLLVRVRGSTDGHNRTLEGLLAVLSGQEPNKTPSVFATTVEEFFWYKLMVANRDERMTGFSVGDVNSLISKFGPNHFCPKGKDPLLYFKLLLFGQGFDQAVSYLYSLPNCQTDAVYIAAVFSYYGLLSPDFDLSKFIWGYYSPFVRVASRYLINLSQLLPSFVSVSLLSQVVSTFSLENLEYMKEVLSPSLLKEVLSRTSVLARDFSDDLSMIALLEMTEKYDDVIYNLNDRLCSLLARFPDTLLPQEVQQRDTLVTAGYEFYVKHESILIDLVSPRDLNIFRLLVSVGQLFAFVDSERFEDAFSTAISIPILPLNGQVDSALREFRSLPVDVKRIIAPLLMVCINLLTQRSVQKDARNRLQYFSSFANKLSYDLPVECTSKLAKLEVGL
ncbi:hypothetical protein GEMRC1_013271 [Eukaryota sp. GEM-RC1]